MAMIVSKNILIWYSQVTQLILVIVVDIGKFKFTKILPGDQVRQKKVYKQGRIYCCIELLVDF